MDSLLKDMDILINHWRPIPRRFPARFQVVTVGSDRKTPSNQIQTAFDTLNFSFILDGGGTYRRGNEFWQVRAPAVVLQWPDEYVEYGPSTFYGFWEEFYMIYDRSSVPDFLASGLLKTGEVFRELGNFNQVRRLINEIKIHTHGEATPENADRLDRMCELLLVESLLGSPPSEPDSLEQAVRSIYGQVMNDVTLEPNFEQLAKDQGLSYSNFRKHWSALFGTPPQRSLILRRIERACEYLVNTDLPISGISEKVGFQDPLYFSRSFKRETGLSASTYRKRYQSPKSFI